jgi:DNA recombination protein Rad52
MTFTEKQVSQLKAPLSASLVKTRKQGGREVSYIEGWKAIEEANRIFGFDGWTRETLEVKCVAEGERSIGQSRDTGYGVTYLAKVRVMVGNVCREGYGSGHGIDRDLGQAHESAIKEAETDAMKRALMTFGNPFGLALYDKTQANVEHTAKLASSAASKTDEFSARVSFMVDCREAIAAFTDAAELGAWWNSEGQKNLRRQHKLEEHQVEALKQAVMNRRDALTPKAEEAA